MSARSTTLVNRGLLLLAAGVTLPCAAFAEEANKWGALLPIGRFFNLALVLGVLVWMARKPLAGFYATRSQTIREQLEEAQRARQEAEAKLAEIEALMSRMDDDLRALNAAAETEAQQEYQRLVATAQLEAAKIVERTKQEISGLTRAAQIELKAHVAELSVKLAEDRIRGEMTDDDRERLFARFVTTLGARK
jgi:F-type H+-transporting ATPase subunit b